ncbi:MAG: transposase [Hyphomicrobiales bacterium]
MNKRPEPEEIVSTLRQVEVFWGKEVPLACVRQIDVVEQTYYRWCNQYGGTGIDKLKERKRFQRENEQLRRAVSDVTLDKLILKEACQGVPRSGCAAQFLNLACRCVCIDYAGYHSSELSCSGATTFGTEAYPKCPRK